MTSWNNTQNINTPYANALSNGYKIQVSGDYPGGGFEGLGQQLNNLRSGNQPSQPTNVNQSTPQPTYTPNFLPPNTPYKWQGGWNGNELFPSDYKSGTGVTPDYGANTLMNNFQGAYSNGLRELYPNRMSGSQPTQNMPTWWDSNFWDNPNLKHYNTHTMEERTSPYSQNSASTPIADMLKRLFGNNNYGMQGW